MISYLAPRRGLVFALVALAASNTCATPQADAGSGAAATSTTAPAPVHSELLPLVASQSLVLDFAEADSRAVAVGERGNILVSESRAEWRQVADVPTRANLTAVDAVGDLLWAVGHDGTILHSADGGLSWSLQRSDPWRPLGDEDEFDPRQGVPLLDVLMLDAQQGFALGAYSLLLRTDDGGAHWERVDLMSEAPLESTQADVDSNPDPTAGSEDDDSWTFDQSDLELEEETDPHLNAMARVGSDALFIVAERGAAYRSRDGGASWERLQMPYEGSMFGVLGYDDGRVVAFGMRGNVFESSDLGDSWQALDTDTELSLMGGARLASGGAVLVGANGVVLHRSDASAPITKHTYSTAAQETPVLATVLAQDGGALVVAGDRGVGRFQVQTQ